MCRQGEDIFIIPPAEPGPLRRENWKNFCEKIGVKICSEKVGDLLYGTLLDGFLQKSLQSINKLCCKQVSVEAAEESYPLGQDEEETTWYIAGYIIFSLRVLAKGKKSVEAVATRQVFSCWVETQILNLIKHLFMSTP